MTGYAAAPLPVRALLAAHLDTRTQARVAIGCLDVDTAVRLVVDAIGAHRTDDCGPCRQALAAIEAEARQVAT